MTQGSVQEIAAQLRNCTSRAAAQAIAETLPGRAIVAVAAELNITVGHGPVATQRMYLVEWAAGRRADSDAIHRAVYSTT